MEIIIICIAAFIFGIGFITGGGWQRSMQEKEEKKQKSYATKNSLK
jgi:hypothetical protein